MKIVFMGTPEYSVPTLQALLDSGHEVVAVYTKPDMPKGRGKKMEITPVKAMAQQYGIPVCQPKSLKSPEEQDVFRRHDADIAVVIAYGLILPLPVLEAYPRGCMNLHASLLPKFRGASPIQSSILAGESKTGVTSMQMDEGLDTGAMLLKSEIVLTGTETAGELHDLLAQLSAKLCIKTLQGMEADTIHPQPQPEDQASYAGKITKEMGRIDWNRSATEIDRQIRAMSPWPSAYTAWNGKTLKIWKAEPLPDKSNQGVPGQILTAGDGGVEVACGQGSMLVQELQLEGKKRLRIGNFLNGNVMSAGQVLEDRSI